MSSIISCYLYLTSSICILEWLICDIGFKLHGIIHAFQYHNSKNVDNTFNFKTLASSLGESEFKRKIIVHEKHVTLNKNCATFYHVVNPKRIASRGEEKTSRGMC